MEILTPLQQRVLQAIAKTPIRDEFYLTGGTALSAFFLQHRFSEDLDFFTPNPHAPGLVPAQLSAAFANSDLRVEFRRTFPSFVECFVEARDGERVKMDFAQDSPFRHEPTRLQEQIGVLVDSQTDICCNKLSALFERAESKDFVDVFFIVHRLMPRGELLRMTKEKHIGLDDYWLTQSFAQVDNLAFLPRMIEPVTLDQLKAYFREWARELMSETT